MKGFVISMLTTLQNVILPETRDADVRSLYSDAAQDPRATAASVSFASYFNAFPAAYWRHWTVVEQVVLTVRTSGAGAVQVYRSNPNGARHPVDSREVSGEAESRFELPLAGFEHGGWYWFDLVAPSGNTAETEAEADVSADLLPVLIGGEWATEQSPTATGRLSLGITTYNKPDYCVATLEHIAGDEALVHEIDRIFLVDQGTQKVREQAGFEEVNERLAENLRLIEQGNLGGSGGFSRAMAETLQREDSDFLLILDDDVEIEPESIKRALQFARFSREPTIVGGHMFDLLEKPVMHAWAEIVEQGLFLWGPSSKQQMRHDFRSSNLRQTAWMHERLDSDYNGWWMCLIPKSVIERLGLSLPVFIKWDDAEYGLRAREQGIRTVSLPGMGLWHISWADKDDTQDWQAFFHTRNRIITGLLHSERPRGGGMLDNSRRQDIKKLLNMQYYAVQLAVEALREVLEGPDRLHERLAESMPRARTIAQQFPETRVYRSDDPDAPVASAGRAASHLGPRPDAMTGLSLALFTVRTVARHWLRRGDESRPPQPKLEFAKRDAFWWVIPSHRSVIVETADGAGKAWYRHDRRKFRRLLRESDRLTRRIRRDWDRLSAEYRRALPELTSVEQWRQTFEGRSR